jgi:hypothetical protein
VFLRSPHLRLDISCGVFSTVLRCVPEIENNTSFVMPVRPSPPNYSAVTGQGFVKFDIEYLLNVFRENSGSLKSYDSIGYLRMNSLIHLAVCLTTSPKPLPKPALHTVRSRVSSFRREYPLLSLRSPSSFLRLLHRLSVSYIPLFIFPSITCCRRQFLHKM